MGRASDRHRGEPWTLGDRVSHPHAADALTLVVGPVSCAGALEPPWPRSPGAAGTRPLPGRDHHLRHGRMPRGRGQGPLSPPHPRSSEFGLWSVDWTSDTCVLSSQGRVTPPTPGGAEKVDCGLSQTPRVGCGHESWHSGRTGQRGVARAGVRGQDCSRGPSWTERNVTEVALRTATLRALTSCPGRQGTVCLRRKRVRTRPRL